MPQAIGLLQANAAKIANEPFAKFSGWLVGGIAATAALVVTNFDKILTVVNRGALVAAMGFLIIALMTGLLAKWGSVVLQAVLTKWAPDLMMKIALVDHQQLLSALVTAEGTPTRFKRFIGKAAVALSTGKGIMALARWIIVLTVIELITVFLGLVAITVGLVI